MHRSQFISVNGVDYECACRLLVDHDNGIDRNVALITVPLEYEIANALFVDNVTLELKVPDRDARTYEQIYRTLDLSDYRLVREIIDHKNGASTVKMGMLNDLEKLIEITYGGVN